MDFYEAIAGQYDQIVNAAGRQGSAETFARWLVETHRPGVVLDVACGTGLHARAIAGLGVEVIAADISEAMIRQGRAAGDADGRIEWLVSPMQDLADRIDGPIGAAICMGNSLAHLLDRSALDRTLAGLAGLLSPGGVLAAQMVNYDRALAQRRRVVGVTRSGPAEHVRFYDFLDDGRVRFNVLTLRWDAGRCTHDLRETLLQPWTRAELAEAFERAGLVDVQACAGRPGEPFEPEASPGLLLIARKAEPAGG